MTAFVTPDLLFVTPDLIAIVTPDAIGRLLLPAGRLPVGAGNDGKGRQAMTAFVTPDLIGRLCCRREEIAGRGRQ